LRSRDTWKEPFLVLYRLIAALLDYIASRFKLIAWLFSTGKMGLGILEPKSHGKVPGT
jgi:hypothetical protein